MPVVEKNQNHLYQVTFVLFQFQIWRKQISASFYVAPVCCSVEGDVSPGVPIAALFLLLEVPIALLFLRQMFTQDPWSLLLFLRQILNQNLWSPTWSFAIMAIEILDPEKTSNACDIPSSSISHQKYKFDISFSDWSWMKVPVKPSGEGPFIPYPLKYCCSGRKRKKSGQMEILPSFSPPIGPRLKLASHPAVQYSSIKHPSNIIHATENQAWIMYVRNNPRRTNKIVFSSPVMTSSMIVHAYDCGHPFVCVHSYVYVHSYACEQPHACV